jgi:hypothetical protein
MVHGGNLLRSEDGGFATYECKSSRDVQWSDPQWSRSGQTEVCRIREIMLLGRQLSVANERIKRLEEAGDAIDPMNDSECECDSGYVVVCKHCFDRSENWRKAKEAKP